MSLKKTIQTDIKNAMIKKDALRVSVLRMALAAILNKEKEKGAKAEELTDDSVLEIVSGEAKKRKDSIGQYEKGGRQDLAGREKKELEILSAYLPEQMGEEEIRKIVKEKVSKLGANGLQDMGKIMGALMADLKNKADGAVVKKIVEEELIGN
ncbi:MAG: GatB/YqeY domain-containing protein [Patescibacteria group bacterium]|nr:GatB/YqeY domain-containing protein [Patescibacteria group bacterium]